MACSNRNFNKDAVASPPELDMELVVISIFSSCDTDKTGVVRVSKLIDCVKGFFEGHSEELSELVIALDPNDSDPSISKEHFFNIMNQWGSAIDKKYLSDNNKRDSDNFKFVPSGHSTPKAVVDGNSDSGKDRFADEIKELEFKIHKLSLERNELRACVNGLECTNETLRDNLSKLAEELASEQQITGRLRAFVKENEDVQESLAAQINKVQVLEDELSINKKLISQLQKKISDFQNEKQNYERQVSKLTESKKATNRAVDELHLQLGLRDGDNNKLKEENAKISNRIAEFEVLVEEYKNCNESLKSAIRIQENCVVKEINRDVAVQKSGNSPLPLEILSPILTLSSESSLELELSKVRSLLSPLSSESSLESELSNAGGNSNAILGTEAAAVPSLITKKQLDEALKHIEENGRKKEERRIFQKVGGVKRKFQETTDELIKFTSSDETQNKFSKNDQLRLSVRTGESTVIRDVQTHNLSENGDGAQVYNVQSLRQILLAEISGIRNDLTNPNPHLQQITDDGDDSISGFSQQPSLPVRKSIMDRIQEAYEWANGDHGLLREILECFVLFCFVVGVISLGQFILNYASKYCNIGRCWDDVFLIKKEYRNGPPPT